MTTLDNMIEISLWRNDKAITMHGMAFTIATGAVENYLNLPTDHSADDQAA